MFADPQEGSDVPGRRELRGDHAGPEGWVRLLYVDVTELLRWRPTTVLGYLIAVAVVSIVLALALIFGVRFHILHRLR